MIDQKNINLLITEKLKEVTGCEVIKASMANVNAPAYPYISFAVLNTDTRKGTYSVSGNTWYIPVMQTWSLTARGDDDNEAQHAAMRAKDWLEVQGRIYLSDHGIMVQRVGAITSQDTLVTGSCEYRIGFEAVFSLMNVIEEQAEVMEQANIEKE